MDVHVSLLHDAARTGSSSLSHRPWAAGQSGTPTWQWQYDAKNRVSQLTIPTRSPGPTGLVLTDRYDALDDLRFHGGGAMLDSMDYDAAGRVATLVHGGQAKQFAYDLRARLDSEVVVAGPRIRRNTYDALGNITNDGTWAYDYETSTTVAAYGRLESRDNGSTTVGYAYDGAGNTTRSGSLTWTSGSTGMSAGGDVEMEYDRWGRMVRQRTMVADNGCSVSTPLHTQERRFTYDALGRRVAMFSRHDCASDKGYWRYWWLDDHVAVKQWNPKATGTYPDTTIPLPDSAWADEAWPSVGAFGHWYAYGPGMDQPLGMWNPPYYVGPELPGEAALTFVRDYRGSVVRTYCAPNATSGSCNSIGSVGTGVDYTAYGSSGAAVPGTPGYNGLESTGGLVYMRNRWYDPNTGRFTQEDPIGYAGGVNLYAYAGNDPVTFSDPFGLCQKDKNGKEDPDCRKVIAELERAAAQADKEKGSGSGDLFREAAGIYRRTERDVKFVPASEWRNNSDRNPTTYTMGQTKGTIGPILLWRGLGQGDLVMTATHEALIHAENKDANEAGMHFGDALDSTRRFNSDAFGRLPAMLLPSAELWRRKVLP